jgi:uncharacterized membrane protein
MTPPVARHTRLISSFFAGIVLYFLLPEEWKPLTRVLVSWNVGVAMFLILAWHFMAGLNATDLRDQYKDEDEAAPVILSISIVAAILAVASIVAYLSGLDAVSGVTKAWHIGLAAATVIHSWTLIPTMFTAHYADLYYSVEDDDRPLRFPDNRAPMFWDFAYFSFTIAAACQTADVATSQGTIRKVVIAHSVLSFFFNASILGFAINVTAGLIGH